MHILIINNLFPPYDVGGAELMTRNLAVGLRRRGHTVTVLTSWYGLQRPQQEEAIWRTLSYTQPSRFDPSRPKWRQLDLLYKYYRGYHNQANARELRRAIATCRPDVICIREVPGLGMSSLFRVLQDVRIPVVYEPGSYWLQYMFDPETETSHLRQRWLKKLLIGNIPPFSYTSLIAVSKTVRQRYVEIGCNAASIEVIYNSVDTLFTATPRLAQANAAANGPTRLLFVGRISAEKGILVLCKALDVLVNERGRKDVLLDIVGAGDPVYLAELRTYLEEKRLIDSVHFYGKLRQEELLRYYDRSYALLFPSIWQEPFGLTVIEAMSRALPVIASNQGGPAEIITQGQDGLLVPTGDESAMADAIENLLSDRELHDRLAKNARDTVMKRFTLAENTRRVESHLLHSLALQRSVLCRSQG